MTSRQVLAWLPGGAVVVIAWLAHPFATALLLGAVLGCTLQPIHDRLSQWSGRPTLVSVAVVLTAGLAIVGSVVGFVSVFVTEAVAFAATVREELKPGGALATWVSTVTGWLGRFRISPDVVVEWLRGAAGGAPGRAGAPARDAAAPPPAGRARAPARLP